MPPLAAPVEHRNEGAVGDGIWLASAGSHALEDLSGSLPLTTWQMQDLAFNATMESGAKAEFTIEGAKKPPPNVQILFPLGFQYFGRDYTYSMFIKTPQPIQSLVLRCSDRFWTLQSTPAIQPIGICLYRRLSLDSLVDSQIAP